MDYSKLLQISQGRQKLNCEPPNQIILEALIVVHLDELVQIDAVKVEHATQMVPEDEVVAQLDDSLDRFWIVVLQK